VRDGILDAVQRLPAVSTIFGLQILRQFSDGDLVNTRRDDAPFDGGALALLQQPFRFLLLLSL